MSDGALPYPRAVTPADVDRLQHVCGPGFNGTVVGAEKDQRTSLTTWGWMFAGEPASTGTARRGAKPPALPITTVDDPALPETSP
ncbi:hypothetical protein ACFRQM_20600 [Streptomyces sp. NPDC056831]|uniref:hypothetical protein n=1 Tax=Streptomyces sp. NPDC056831 TaxID=3345954 RepID=UPI0036C0BD3B